MHLDHSRFFRGFRLARDTSGFGSGALAAVAGLILLGSTSPAAAHIIQGGAGGFSSGFEHPLTGADHFLAMFAVGLWGAQMGGRPVWSLPVAFPLIMVVGGIGGILGIPMSSASRRASRCQSWRSGLRSSLPGICRNGARCC
ncbi:HupE/UreJ family protein [Breoghania sp.]|uniref:HupE/UreJ family protein n=1 Tax=Breoghania sp. TaxID=2065378 RepID=UPI0026386494|nr:HupE/UreJ family protein [Breoghania sp.]MDJ0931126.1 HupE/UreJ family protein [Breoghania sp.]